ELERDHLRKAREAIEKLTGRRPVGTRSWHTRQLLLEEGYIYNSHDTPDHRPHYVSEPDGSKPLLNLPFHYAIDDAMFFSFAWLGSDNQAQRMMDPDHVLEIWWEAFQHQYKQGGYYNICMHPFVSGRALRIAMLDRLIERMKRLPGVWFPTCEQVARHCLAAHPPRGGGRHAVEGTLHDQRRENPAGLRRELAGRKSLLLSHRRRPRAGVRARRTEAAGPRHARRLLRPAWR